MERLSPHNKQSPPSYRATAVDEARPMTSSQEPLPTEMVESDAARDVESQRAARPDYLSRRMSAYRGTTPDYMAMAPVSQQHPLSVQVRFRVKMLSIFVLQLLVVGAVVTVFRFVPEAKRWADDVFNVTAVVLSGVATAVLLVVLFTCRKAFLLNWLALLLFSAAQSALFVGLGVVADTNVGVLNCGFTICCVFAMLVLAGVRRPKRGLAGLLSTFHAGAIGYLVTAVVVSALFIWKGRAFISDEGFAATLGFQLCLVLWFAYDAMRMYDVMTLDEYMHGVIYFYTDFIWLALMVAFGAAVAAVCDDVFTFGFVSPSDWTCMDWLCFCTLYNGSDPMADSCVACCGCCRDDLGCRRHLYRSQPAPQPEAAMGTVTVADSSKLDESMQRV
ncbi:hypothetical protein PINS_up005786 [Pythium insidiosum]|nr:hypothetical protein PINS_up005786 [Pythium insidiosum]